MALALLLLAGCAFDPPQPLDDPGVGAVPGGIERADVAVAVAEITHPYLAPQRIDFGRPMTPASLGLVAVVSSPVLRALRAQQAVQGAQAFAAGLLPDPVLTFGFDHVLSPASESTALAAGLTLDALAGLFVRSMEQARSRSDAGQLRLDIAWQEWLTAGQAELLATRWLYQRMAEREARQAADRAKLRAAATARAFSRGDLSAIELAAARSLEQDTVSRAVAFARDAESTRLELNQLLGAGPQERFDIADATPAPRVSAGADALFAAARMQRLDLRALELGYVGREQGLQRALIGQYPRLSITLNRMRDTGGVQTFGPSVALDLPVWNRNRGAIAVARAERRSAAAEYAAHLHAARAEIAALVAALQSDEAELSRLEDALPAAEAASTAAVAAEERGDITQLVADFYGSVATDHRLNLIAVRQRCAEQHIALRLAVGTPIRSGSEAASLATPGDGT